MERPFNMVNFPNCCFPLEDKYLQYFGQHAHIVHLLPVLSLVPTSDITIIIIIISTNITLLCRLCLSGNVQKHSHKRSYDQHNHNHKKMIDHFLMTMIMSMTMTMLLFFIVGTRKS